MRFIPVFIQPLPPMKPYFLINTSKVGTTATVSRVFSILFNNCNTGILPGIQKNKDVVRPLRQTAYTIRYTTITLFTLTNFDYRDIIKHHQSTIPSSKV